MLSISNLSKSYGDRLLFEKLYLTITTGQRIALIGANGSGKSTLLDIIASETEPDVGTFSLKRNSTIGYLKQNFDHSYDKTPLEELLLESNQVSSLREKLTSLYEDLSSSHEPNEHAGILKEINQIETTLETETDLDRDYQAKTILSGLGFSEDEFQKPIKEFSGGWIMRVVLGKLLFKSPDILLLDEPTNHLDLEANLWFERFLISFNGAVLFTSHDRTFLNQVATSVLSIETDEVVSFPGNYDEYVIARQRYLESREAIAEKQEREIQRQMRFVERFRSKARRATQVQSRLKQLAKLQDIKIPRVTKRVNYTFPKPPRAGLESLRLSGVSKSYDSNIVYEDLNLVINRGDRIALIGPNGAGKSTLLKILAGVIPFDNGERKVGHNVISAYYSQHLLDLLNEANTVIDELRQVAKNESDQSLRNVLGGFLFSGDDVFKPISVLSGGEKARVALAKVLMGGSNLLFLDEPTNHLDIISREILTDSLSDYAGTICLITHDRTLIKQLANKIIDVTQGKVKIYQGKYDNYLEQKQATYLRDFDNSNLFPEGNNTAQISTDGRAIENEGSNSLKSRHQLRRSLNKEARSLETRAGRIQETLERNEVEVSRIEDLFSNPSEIHDTIELTRLGTRYEELKKEIQSLWDEWEKLSIKSESIVEEITALEVDSKQN